MTLLFAICLLASVTASGQAAPQKQQALPDLAGYKLAELELTGSTIFRIEILKNEMFSIKNGDPFDPRLIKEGLQKIENYFLVLGYMDFTYSPIIKISHDEKTVTCSFHLDPGRQFRIDQISIFGTRSRDEEIEARSEIGALSVKEKAIFSKLGLELAILRLKMHYKNSDLTVKEYNFRRSTKQFPGDNGGIDISIWLQAKQR